MGFHYEKNNERAIVEGMKTESKLERQIREVRWIWLSFIKLGREVV